MSLSSVVTMGYRPASEASLPLVVLMGYNNGAEAPIPPPEVEIPHFGGGPFTRRFGYYGYGDEEDKPQEEEIREIAQEVLAEVVQPTVPVIAQARREFIDVPRVERAAKEVVRRIWTEEVARRKLELEQEEAIVVLLAVM